MPSVRLNGNVIPRLLTREREALAFGSAIFTAAGAAIYEALAHRTAKAELPPTLNPNKVPLNAPMAPARSGKAIANIANLAPTIRKSEIREIAK